MRKVDILIARLKAKQKIRKVKEARALAQMEKSQNVPTNQQQRPPEGEGIPTNQPVRLGGDDGAGVEP